MNELIGILFEFEDKQAAGTLAFTQGKPYLGKTPQELIGGTTCFGRSINWKRLLEKRKTKAGRWWARWSYVLNAYQQQLRDQEAKFEAVQEEIKQLRTSRAKKERATVEKLEEFAAFLKTVEAKYLETLDLLKWAIESVSYQILKRAG